MLKYGMTRDNTGARKAPKNPCACHEPRSPTPAAPFSKTLRNRLRFLCSGPGSYQDTTAEIFLASSTR